MSKVEIELATDSQHPVSQEEGNLSKGEFPNDYRESPRIRKKGAKWDDKFGSPVIWWDEKKDSEELAELSSNSSTKLSFEIDDLSEHKGSKLEAIQGRILFTRIHGSKTRRQTTLSR